MEIWKAIKDYENYQVSNLGNVKSLNYGRTGKEKILKLQITPQGYNFVILCTNGKRKPLFIHRIVYQTFKAELVEGLVIDHISGIKTQNNIENLQQITNRANTVKGYNTRNTSSKYPGVSWHKRNEKWLAYIRINGERKYLGVFNNELEAAAAYQAELSKINF